MALLEWREEFCTGIAGVDFEHEALIRQINSVYAMIGDQADRELVVDSLGEIYGSISAHFALEENMMQRHQYAAYAEHKADHERLLDEIRDITDAFEVSERLDDERLTQKLREWFQVHFQTHDSRLHRLTGMPQHEAVTRSTLRSLIENAKDRLLNR